MYGLHSTAYTGVSYIVQLTPSSLILPFQTLNPQFSTSISNLQHSTILNLNLNPTTPDYSQLQFQTFNPQLSNLRPPFSTSISTLQHSIILNLNLKATTPNYSQPPSQTFNPQPSHLHPQPSILKRKRYTRSDDLCARQCKRRRRGVAMRTRLRMMWMACPLVTPGGLALALV